METRPTDSGGGRERAMAVRRPRESSIVSALTSSPLPYPVLLIVVLVLLLWGVSSYLSYESVVDDVVDQFNWVLLLVPVILLLIIQWLSAYSGDVRVALGFLPYNPRNYRQQRREGSSPWGVAAVLVMLLVMIYFQPAFLDQWLFFGD